MTIRRMQISDIDKVIELEEDIFGETLGYTLFFNDLTSNPQAKYFVVTIDEEIVSYIGSWQSYGVCEILNFLVSKNYQRQKIGSTLLNFFIDDCEENDVSSIFLEVKETNISAISLYEKMGFSVSGRREKYYNDLSDAIIYVKHLSDDW